MSGLSASSSKGSPVASAKMLNSTTLIPSTVGTAIRSLRSRYWYISLPLLPLALPYPPAQLCLSVPIRQIIKNRAPGAQRQAPQCMAHRGYLLTPDHRDDYHVLDQEIVHPDEERGAPDRIQFGLRLFPEAIVLGVGPAYEVPPRPLVGLLRALPTHELAHRPLGIEPKAIGKHLHIRIKMGVCIGIARIAGEKDVRGDHLQLDPDADALQGLLNDGLRLLPDRVGCGLEHDLHAAAVLVAHAVAPPPPAGFFQQLRGFVEIEFPAGVRGLKLLRGVEVVAGGLAGRTVELFGDGAPIDGCRQCLPHPVVGEQGMWHLEAAALAIHLGPGIRAVEIDVLNTCAREHTKPALTPLLFQPLHDVLL